MPHRRLRMTGTTWNQADYLNQARQINNSMTKGIAISGGAMSQTITPSPSRSRTFSANDFFLSIMTPPIELAKLPSKYVADCGFIR